MIRTIALCLIASPIAAETVCIPRADLIATLDTDYAERQMVRAEETRGGLIEFYVSSMGSWTMVLIPPAPGPLQACLIASGTGFMMIAQGVEG